MLHTRATLQIKVDLDPIPGWGNTPEDYQKLLQKYLNDTVSCYRPEVTIIGTEEVRREN